MDKVEQLESKINSLEKRLDSTSYNADIFSTCKQVPNYTDVLKLGIGRYKGSHFINAPYELDPTAIATVTVTPYMDVKRIEISHDYMNRVWVRNIHTVGNSAIGWAQVYTRRLLWHGSLTMLNQPVSWFSNAGVSGVGGSYYQVRWESPMWGQADYADANTSASGVIELINHTNSSSAQGDPTKIERNTVEGYFFVNATKRQLSLVGPFTGVNSSNVGNTGVLIGSDKPVDQNYIKITDLWEIPNNYADDTYFDKLTTTTTTTK